MFAQADVPRVRWFEHGVIVAALSWACHRSRFTTAFGAHLRLAGLPHRVERARDPASQLAVGGRDRRACARRGDRARGSAGRAARRVGIDEISRKGQRCPLCAVDHDTVRLVWAGKGRNAETLRGLFDLLVSRGQRKSAT